MVWASKFRARLAPEIQCVVSKTVDVAQPQRCQTIRLLRRDLARMAWSLDLTTNQGDITSREVLAPWFGNINYVIRNINHFDYLSITDNLHYQ